MARAMGTNAYGKEPRRGERTLSRGFTHRRARRAGLRPGLFSSAPNWASNRARTRLARREELGIKAQTRVENVETPGHGVLPWHGTLRRPGRSDSHEVAPREGDEAPDPAIAGRSLHRLLAAQLRANQIS